MRDSIWITLIGIDLAAFYTCIMRTLSAKRRRARVLKGVSRAKDAREHEVKANCFGDRPRSLDTDP